MYVVWFDAVRKFFAQAQWRGANVLTVFAGPDRAHTEAARVTAQRTGKTIKEIEDGPTPVPFMSVWIDDPKFLSTYFNPGRLTLTKDKSTGIALVSRFMHSMEAQVQVDLWCGSVGGHGMAQSITSQIELRFYGKHVLLPVDWADSRWYKPPYDVAEHASHYGTQSITLLGEGWSDSSDLEAGDGPGEVRKTWSGRIEALLPRRPEDARLVQSVSVDIRTMNDELLGTVDTGG